MPSTSKKQHNFMTAIANNPSFAKKVGIPQSVGKDFSAADKGRKFEKGGDMKRYDEGGDDGLADAEGNTAADLAKMGRVFNTTLTRQSQAERFGRQEGVKEYPKRKQTEDSISNPIVRGARKATTYVKDKYGDLRDDVRTAITNDNSAAFRKGQRAIREKEYGYKKGGMAHGGMHKMPNGKMMKNSAMKEGGMPMKDGKPAFMMGKKKMMGGGIAKYAKGGGIESRGKTKGTIIRMAAGGSVGSASRRADGIAQRGKTRG